MKITKQQYYKNRDLFKVLEISGKDALGKDLEELSHLITKQYRTLARKHHSDKGGNDELMKKLNAAKERLDDFVEKVKKFPTQDSASSPGSSNSKEHSHTYSSSGSRGFTFSSSNSSSGQSSYTFFSTGSSHSSHSSKENMDENHNSMHMNNSNIRRNYGSIHMNNGTIKRDHSKAKPSQGASFFSGSGINMSGGEIFVNGVRIQPGTAFSNVIINENSVFVDGKRM